MVTDKDRIVASSRLSPRRGGRPSRAVAEEIADTIIGKARELFFMHGYGATSVEMIAASARISKRTFYHRFENKAAIFRAMVNSLIQGITPPHVEALFEGLDCEAILQKLADAILHASLSPETLSLQRILIAEAMRFPELALIMSEQGARGDAIKRIAALLTKENSTGRLAVDDPHLAAELFLSMVVSQPQRRALGLGIPMNEAELKTWARGAVSLFLNGVRQTK